ncbi:uncharacterized protein [Periplaneta americana]|uniref:uncharacterized protein isoform X6 n=1 Tax=Periplaneta americana TaxID=6978 RepID=UPI0037E73666
MDMDSPHKKVKLNFREKPENSDWNRVKDKRSQMTIRDARRVYKMTLAALREKEMERTAQAKPFKYAAVDCLRCEMTSEGMIFIPGFITSSCIINVPEEIITVSEEDVTELGVADSTDISSSDYLRTLAVSTAMGSIKSTPPITANVPLANKVKTRTLEKTDWQHTIDREYTGHNCSKSIVAFDDSKDSIVFEEREDGRDSDNLNSCNSSATQTRMQLQRQGIRCKATAATRYTHAVIYAPSGLGKTTFQHKLISKGIYIADTDDIPYVDKDDISEMLKWTSVLTNRLDLLDGSWPTIAFVPFNAEILTRRCTAYGIANDEDAKYVFECHKFLKQPQLLICQMRDSYVSQWFF